MLKAVINSSTAFSRKKAKWLQTTGGGPTPAYSLNFVSGSLDGSLTFTRASTATYYNSSGIIASAANNNPRFDYNPSTLAPNGLLIEGAATNLSIQSNLQSGWSTDNAALVPAAGTSPDGTNDANTITDNATSGPHYIQSPYTAVSGNIAISVYAQAGTATVLQVGWQGGVYNYANFNLANGTVGTFNATSATIQNVGNGWYRCTITVTGATGNYIYLALTNNSTTAAQLVSYIGTGQTLSVFGTQLEIIGAGGSSTSYIPTTSSAVTRATDIVYNSSISGWYNPTAGTMFFEYLTQTLTPSGFMSSLNAGSNSNYIGSYWSASPNAKGVIEVSGTEYDTGTITVAGNTVTKTGIAYTAGNNNFAINGTLASNGTAATSAIPSGLNQLSLGGNVATTSFWLRNFAYYNTRLTNTQLQTITAAL